MERNGTLAALGAHPAKSGLPGSAGIGATVIAGGATAGLPVGDVREGSGKERGAEGDGWELIKGIVEGR